MNIQPNGDVLPCCIADRVLGNVNDTSMETVWNGAEMRDLRRTMLRDEIVPACARCLHFEANGFRSLRQNYNRDAAHHFDQVHATQADGTVDRFNVVSFDIRFTNLCNMKCRTCGVQASSKWAEDRPSDGPAIRRIVDRWDEIDRLIPAIEQIYFAGGEPLLMEQHYILLSKLIAAKRFPTLLYSSNVSRLGLQQYRVAELWRHFPRIHLLASIDQLGKKANYTRHGVAWDRVYRNLCTIRDTIPHVHIDPVPTISIFNILDISHIVETLIAAGLVHDRVDLRHLLITPAEFSIQVLPSSLKTLADQRLMALSERQPEYRSAVDRVRDYLWREDHWLAQRSLLREHLAAIDRLRGECFVDTFPEMEALMHD